MRGVNRALVSEMLYESQVNKNCDSRTCVFISHKSADMDAANAVAEYLISNGIDVYLDKMDTGLQKDTKEMNARGIVNAINKALKRSTHILVLVSDQTKESWWVPYEVGYAKNGEKKIASALLVGYIDDFPDYLKIEKTIKSPEGFKLYAEELKRETNTQDRLFENVMQYTKDPYELEKYIRTVK